LDKRQHGTKAEGKQGSGCEDRRSKQSDEGIPKGQGQDVRSNEARKTVFAEVCFSGEMSDDKF